MSHVKKLQISQLQLPPYARCDVLTAVILKVQGFWEITNRLVIFTNVLKDPSAFVPLHRLQGT
jgi:hypothetical protein